MIARIAQIWRHPIKGHGREAIDHVTLAEGRTMPWDRTWAIAHAASKATGENWAPSLNFSRGSKAPGLTGISAKVDEATGSLTLSHPDLDDITLDPDRDAQALITWAASLMPPDRVASARVIRVAGRGMTDSDFPSVSLGTLPSLRALGQKMGFDVAARRFRMNFWLDGLEPWQEFEWIGRRLALGEAEIEVRARTIRCRATMSNPDTGKIDADTLAALKEGWGHQDFGVYAVVTRGGRVTVGDAAGPVA